MEPSFDGFFLLYL